MSSADVDDRRMEIDEDTCLALTGDAEQCGNGTDTDASDPEAGLCGVHAGSDAVRVTDFDNPAWVGLRDEFVEIFRSETEAYALATISPDVKDIWNALTGLQDLAIGPVELTASQACGHARALADHPDLDIDDHPLVVGGCIALQGKSAKNHSCPNSGYGTTLLCGMHKDADLRGTVLDDGEPGPDLDTVTVGGAEYQLVEQRGDDLIVVDPDEWELRRLEDAAGSETRWSDAETTPDLSDDAETLVLVGCGDSKADESRKAKDLRLKRRYAEEHGDEWAILSAKYGLLDHEAEIEPGDVTVDDIDVGEWGVAVAADLPDVRDTEVVILAGPDYAEEVEGTLFLYGADVKTPTEGMNIGERISWLSEQLDEDEDDVGADETNVNHGGYPFVCYDCADRFEEQPPEETCSDCGGPIVRVVELYELAPDGGKTCSSSSCDKPAIWEAEQPATDDIPRCAGHASGFLKSQLTMLVDAERPNIDNDGQENVEGDGDRDDDGDEERDRLKAYLRANYSTDPGAEILLDAFDTVEEFEAASFEEQLRAAGLQGRALTAVLDEYESVIELQYRGGSSGTIAQLDGVGQQSAHVVNKCFLSWSTLAGAPPRGWNALVDGEPEIAPDGGGDRGDEPAPEGPPQAPMNLPKYLREGVEKQSPDRLRALAEYAEKMAAWKEAEAERELEERAEQDVDETPDKWEDDEWKDVVEDAREEADLAPSKGTLTTKHIDGRDYYYLQWREGDNIKSQYVAPVVPADGGSSKD